MAARNTVNTPLHLLQELSTSLLAHLEEACAQARADAEKLLLKLDKQRAKAQQKLDEARASLEKAAAAGKAGAQAKARARIEKFELLLDALQASDRDTRVYLTQLQGDSEESLRLARQHVGKAADAAARALATREPAPRTRTRAVKAAAVPLKKAPTRTGRAKGAAR